MLPGALAAAWTPLVLLLLGRLPAGDTLGALTPLTAAVPALMAGLGTLLGALLLTRFEAAVDGGQTPEGAAADALETAGPAVRWAGGLTCAGLGLLALSGLFPVGVPYLVGFGLVALLGVALAVAAVFTLMLPVAVVLARRSPGGTPAAAVSRRPGVSGRRRSAA